MKPQKSIAKLLRRKYITAYRSKKKAFAYRPEVRERISEADQTLFTVTAYSADFIETKKFEQADQLIDYLNASKAAPEKVLWIDAAGITSPAIKKTGSYFHIHPLLIEDILSNGQRAKLDDMGNQLFALLPQLSYNQENGIVDQNQITVAVLDGFVLSFHNEPQPSCFTTVQDKISKEASPARKNKADYLFYLILDAIIDQYFTVTDILSDQFDQLEDAVIESPEKSTLLNLALLRHKVMVVKHAIMPVRELIDNLWRSDNQLIEKETRKFFKDIHDHITLVTEYNENYREMIINLQDLYMNQVNTKMNEVMKILTIITALLVPFSVISGIYGMNFSRIPFTSAPHGFFVSLVCMFGISALMLLYFKRKDWF